MKTLDEILDILFFGSKEEMLKISCPECSGKIFYEINNMESMRIQCTKCGTRMSINKITETPNCHELFGEKHIFEKVSIKVA